MNQMNGVNEWGQVSHPNASEWGPPNAPNGVMHRMGSGLAFCLYFTTVVLRFARPMGSGKTNGVRLAWHEWHERALA